MRPAPDLLARRLLFFTGKGGVGKSTVTAATALLAAEQGQRVLVVEADDKGAIPGNFEQPSVGFTVARGEDTAEMQRLCRVFEASEEEGRRLIRLFAELSVSDALEIPPRM